MTEAPASSSSLDALKELATIRDYVLHAQSELRSGRMPNMTSLEARTADLCRLIHDATKDIQQKCAPELKDLAGQLSECEQELRKYYDTVLAPRARQ